MIKISVVIPTYKRPDYLERLLKSIGNNIEFINDVVIVDDCSPNIKEYKAMLQDFQDKFNITFIHNSENRGAPYCRNLGISLAKEEYIALTDDDDEWCDGKVEAQIQKISDNVGLIYTWARSINDKNEIKDEYCLTKEGNIVEELLKKNMIPSSSVIVNKQAVEKVGGFDVRQPSCQDWDMWLRIAKAGYDVACVEDFLLIYHKASRDSIGKSQGAKKGYYRFYRKHFRLFVQYFFISNNFRKYIKIGIMRRLHAALNNNGK
ncbi:MAG: glycosyltransferase [Lachnospiraceae bacterium]|jgi:glycosyltransferase involved in cell wall biosynthesis|nr:glycosyltransferase [Lachnospiraceae bacterium]